MRRQHRELGGPLPGAGPACKPSKAAAKSRWWPHFTPATLPFTRPPTRLQDKVPIDLCQACWSNAFRFTREVLAGY